MSELFLSNSHHTANGFCFNTFSAIQRRANLCLLSIRTHFHKAKCPLRPGLPSVLLVLLGGFGMKQSSMMYHPFNAQSPICRIAVLPEFLL